MEIHSGFRIFLLLLQTKKINPIAAKKHVFSLCVSELSLLKEKKFTLQITTHDS
jgi:hypothetical protein